MVCRGFRGSLLETFGHPNLLVAFEFRWFLVILHLGFEFLMIGLEWYMRLLPNFLVGFKFPMILLE